MTVPPVSEPLLRVRGLNAWYGRAHILQGVDLEVGAGEIAALLGRNGAGRSTICRAIMGHLDVAGEILFGGASVSGLAPHEVALTSSSMVALAPASSRQSRPRRWTDRWS